MSDSNAEVRAAWAQAFLDTMRPEAKEELGDFAHDLLRVVAGRRQGIKLPDDRDLDEPPADVAEERSA